MSNFEDGADDAVVPELGNVVVLTGEAAMETTAQYPSGTVHFRNFSNTMPSSAPYFEVLDKFDALCGEFDTINEAVHEQLGAEVTHGNTTWKAPTNEVFISACVWRHLSAADKNATRALVDCVYVPDYDTVPALHM